MHRRSGCPAVKPHAHGAGTVAAGSGRDRHVHTSRLLADSRYCLPVLDAFRTNLITDGRGFSAARIPRPSDGAAAVPTLPPAIFTPSWNRAKVPVIAATPSGPKTFPVWPRWLSLNGMMLSRNRLF